MKTRGTLAGQCPGFQIHRICVEGRPLGLEVSRHEWFSSALVKAFPRTTVYFKVSTFDPQSVAEKCGVVVGDILCLPPKTGVLYDSDSDGGDSPETTSWGLVQTDTEKDSLLKSKNSDGDSPQQLYLYVARPVEKKQEPVVSKTTTWTLTRDLADQLAQRHILSKPKAKDLLKRIKLCLTQQWEQEQNSVLEQLPKHVKEMFGHMGIAKFSKSSFFPAIAMSPYDVPPGPIRENWFQMFHKVRCSSLVASCCVSPTHLAVYVCLSIAQRTGSSQYHVFTGLLVRWEGYVLSYSPVFLVGNGGLRIVSSKASSQDSKETQTNDNDTTTHQGSLWEKTARANAPGVSGMAPSRDARRCGNPQPRYRIVG
jgi:hypothetical protein